MATLTRREKKKLVVEESFKTKKAREKLKKKLEAQEKKLTPQALEKTTIEIHKWIARHASQRIALRAKSISLFDENQNAAKISKKIHDIVDQINKNPVVLDREQESYKFTASIQPKN